MELDLELYRREVIVCQEPRIRLSAIDVSPEHPRRTLVLLHGFGGQARQWVHQLQHFGMRNRVIALDMRGHGRSDCPPDHVNMPDLLKELKCALDALGLPDRFIVAGHSFGGAVASEFAAAYPESVEGLVLIATAAEFRLNPLYRLALNLPLPVLRMVEPFTRKWLSASPAALRRWYHPMLAKWNGWSLFRDLDVPTLVIRGHRDVVFAKPAFEEVSRAIAGAEDVDVGASGHMVMLERREAVNRVIESFLGGTTSSWRDEGFHAQTTARAELVLHRPWLVHYDDRVPFTIAIPRVPLDQFLRSAMRRFPGRVAIQFEGLRLTYRRLRNRVNRFANALRSLGLETGDRVMLLLPNIPQLIIAYFGTLRSGGVVVFTLPVTDPQELVRQARDSGARYLIATPDHRELLSQVREQTAVESVIITSLTEYLPRRKRLALKLSGKEVRTIEDNPELGIYSFSPLLRVHSREAPQVDVSTDDPAVIIYTGGTTAEPKGVLLSHRNLVANTIQTRHWIPEAHEGKERFLCVLPFSHSYGMTTGMNVPVALGATLIVKPRFEVKDTLETIRRLRPTIFPGVPQMYLAISNFPGVRKYGIKSVKACISGAAPLPVEVQEAFEKLTRGRVVEGYGLTESSPVTHANPLYGRRKVGSIGIPVPSTEAKVVSLTNPRREVPPNHIGELVVRGPQVMVGYWNNPEATREAILRDRWLLTGDVAQMDADGYFRIVARKADLWYPGKPGKPAFPRDVEEVIFEVPQVKEAAVVAIAGKPVAFVIAKEKELTSETVFAYCRRRLPPEMVPRIVVFLDDFPRTFIGKVLRRELAKRFAERDA